MQVKRDLGFLSINNRDFVLQLLQGCKNNKKETNGVLTMRTFKVPFFPNFLITINSKIFSLVYRSFCYYIKIIYAYSFDEITLVLYMLN